MAQPIPAPKFKTQKPIEVKWNKWSKGLDTLVAATKIRDDELSIANNIILVDEGSPTKRWGTDIFGATEQADDIYSYYKSDGSNKLIKIKNGIAYSSTDLGLNWALISGGSFSSGIRTDGVLAFDTLYFSNGTDNLTKYDGNGLSVFSSLNAPASTWVTRGQSLASGPSLYSYRITAVNSVGETIAAAAATVATIRRREEWQTAIATPNQSYGVQVNWNKVTGASGYNIYGVTGGDETYIDHVDGDNVLNYIDYGITTPSAFFNLPTGNSTTGPKGRFIIEFKSSLIISGDTQQPSRVYFSAGVDKIDSFLISDGGGYIDVSKNSSDGDISGLAKYQNKTVVFKKRSTWQMDFTESAIPALTSIVNDIGCVSHRTIVNVENDLFFLGRKVGGGAAIYVLGNEPNYLNILRTNEVSARVRPEFKAVSLVSLEKSTATYYDGKYIVFYPEGSSTINDKAIVYDRERLGFTKWSEIYVRGIIVHYDTQNREYLIYADGMDTYLSRLDESFTTDKGDPIMWSLKTKESDLDAPFLYKKYKWVNLRLRNVLGTVRIRVWTDSNITAFTAAINQDSDDTAFGSWQFGAGSFGTLVDESESDTTSESYIIRRIPISRQGTVAIARSLAVEIYGETTISKATLLDVNIEARPKSKNFYPRDEVIT